MPSAFLTFSEHRRSPGLGRFCALLVLLFHWGPTTADAEPIRSQSARDQTAVQSNVVVEPDRINVRLSNGATVVLGRYRYGGITGVDRVDVAGRTLLFRGPEHHRATIALVSPGTVGGVTDWPGYLRRRYSVSGQEELAWRPVGRRDVREAELGDGRYLGHRIEGDRVILTIQSSFEASARVSWIVQPAVRFIGGKTYSGIGWSLEVAGLENGAWITLEEDAVAGQGDRYIQQTWGRFIEHSVGADDGMLLEMGWLNADHQPLTFIGGSSGAVVSYFETPIAARMGVTAYRSWLRHHWEIPLGKGSVRRTPVKLWLVSMEPLPTKWAQLDEWVRAYDTVASAYRDHIGLAETQPRPTLWWQHPSERDYAQIQEGDVPPADAMWLRRFRREGLVKAAAYGFGAVYMEGLWDVDGLHGPDAYLPLSQSFGSIDAPWDLEISPALGGLPALRELVADARSKRIDILLWTSPGHLSNSSPLLRLHPEWVRWRFDGTPETAGYGDVVGVDLRSGYFDHAVSRYRAVREATGFSGFWIDSYLTFGMLPEGQEEQISPQFDRTLALQRTWQEMDATELHIEGCGPFGVSSGGYGIEGFILGGEEDRAVAIARFDDIRGREYGLYRYIADTFIEPTSYFRALASKGAVAPFDLALLDQLDSREQKFIAWANRTYAEVLPDMVERQLIGDGNAWQGVRWTNPANRSIILFAFDRLTIETEGAVVVDLFTGTEASVKTDFTTEPFRIYRMAP